MIRLPEPFPLDETEPIRPWSWRDRVLLWGVWLPLAVLSVIWWAGYVVWRRRWRARP